MIFQCVAVVIAMVCQDTFATTMVIAESRNLRRWAGTMDALNDYASRVGTIITAGAYIHTGFFSWQTQILLLLTAITSYNTTSRVTGLANRLLPGRAA